MDNFNIHKFFKSEYLSEDRKAKEYIKSIEDKDEREAEKERMFGDDEKPSKFKKAGKKAGFDMRGLKEIIKTTVKEYTSEYDPATAKRNAFAASYNRPGDTERFRNYMEFLSKLRISGKTNMLGAVPYLQAEFNLEKKEAKDLLAYWMGSYRNPDLDESLNEDNSYVKVSKPRFIKDKNNPNFLNVYMDYDLGSGGASIALGKETMTGQIRRESAAEALKQMNDIADDLKSRYDIEDIEITDMENGKIQLFAVSDDFIDIGINEMDMNDPVVMKMRAQQDQYDKELEKSIEPKVDFDEVLDLRDEKGDLERRIKNLYREMENDPDVEGEGGAVADQYGDELNKLETRLYKVMKQINQYDMNESLNESLNPEVSKVLDRFIKAMAKRYSYSEQDAVFAIQAALKQRDADGVKEGSCGYTPDGKPRKKPAGPNLLKLKETVFSSFKK